MWMKVRFDVKMQHVKVPVEKLISGPLFYSDLNKQAPEKRLHKLKG